MNKMTTKISIEENNSEGLFVRFELTNNTKTALFILKRDTPLEGLKTDCLRVTRDGKLIRYDGYLVKRAYPKPAEFLKLQPGETTSNIVNISEAYDTSQAGKYSIEFDDRHLVIVRDVPVTSTSLAFKIVSLSLDISLKNQAANVTKKVATEQRTAGHTHRLSIKKKVLKTVSTLQKKNPAPVVSNGTPAQEKALRKAHRDGLKYAKKAKISNSPNALYETWFGKYTAARSKKVDTVFSKIISRLETVTFTYIVVVINATIPQ